jgi:hypothetical protein
MAFLSSFEVLAETLVPANILPPTAADPFVIQGYWVQISLPPGSVSQVQFNLLYQETTDFTQGEGQKTLQAQIIDQTGAVKLYPSFFASTGRGFLSQIISVGQTLIYGIQCLPPSITTANQALPQNGTGWRGTVQITSSNPGSLIATPTQRLLYLNIGSLTKGTPLDAMVYAVPTYSGGTRI